MSFFPKKHTHEVFLSHAVEDRAAIADELYARLYEAGIKLWYSANALTTGEDLKNEIEQAIADSRFGVVVFSKGSIHRQWMITELNWLEIKEDDKTKVILPFLYDMTIEEFAAIYPRLASRFCIQSSRGLDFAVERILALVVDHRVEVEKKKRKQWILSSLIAFACVFAVTLITYIWTHDRPTSEQIEITINDRIEKLTKTIDNRYIEPFKLGSSVVQQNRIDSARTAYQNFKSYFRNEYEFNNGFSIIRARKNVEEAIGQSVVELSDSQGFGMDSLNILWSKDQVIDGFQHSSFSFINKRRIEFKWEGVKNGALYTVKVHYSNGIQYINISLTTPPTSAGTKRHEMILVGLPPTETYYFEKDADGKWYFKEVR